jgi:hypothetical protein
MTCAMSLELQDQEIIMTSLWENKLRKVEADAPEQSRQTKRLKAAHKKAWDGGCTLLAYWEQLAL